MNIKVIKGYTKLTESLSSSADLPAFEDRAVADFRGFYSIAEIHTTRVKNPLVIETMCEILDALKNNLQTRRSIVD